MQEAEAVIRERRRLKQSAVVIHDVLTQMECDEHTRLWGEYIAAKQAGKAVYFVRDKLFVEGKRVFSQA